MYAILLSQDDSGDVLKTNHLDVKLTEYLCFFFFCLNYSLQSPARKIFRFIDKECCLKKFAE